MHSRIRHALYLNETGEMQFTFSSIPGDRVSPDTAAYWRAVIQSVSIWTCIERGFYLMCCFYVWITTLFGILQELGVFHRCHFCRSAVELRKERFWTNRQSVHVAENCMQQCKRATGVADSLFHIMHLRTHPLSFSVNSLFLCTQLLCVFEKRITDHCLLVSQSRSVHR